MWLNKETVSALTWVVYDMVLNFNREVSFHWHKLPMFHDTNAEWTGCFKVNLVWKRWYVLIPFLGLNNIRLISKGMNQKDAVQDDYM